MLFRLKQLQGFSSRVTSGFIFVDEKASSVITASRDADKNNAESLGIKTKDIVAAEIITPASMQQYQQVAQTSNSRSRLQGAAAGAVLGFLLAGPLGTVIGSAAGSHTGGSRRQTAFDREQAREAQRHARIASDAVGLIAIDDAKGILVTISDTTMSDFLKLQRLVNRAQTKKSSKVAKKAVDIKSLEKECPDCAEDVKLKAKVCRFCGYKWSQSDVDRAVKRALSGK